MSKESLGAIKKTIWRTLNGNNKEFLQQFLNNSETQKSSLIQYETVLKNFFIWNRISNNDTDLRDISKKDFQQYINYLIIDEKLKINSIQFKKNVLSTFYAFLNKNFNADFPENKILSIQIDNNLLENRKNKKSSKLSKADFNFLEKYLSKSDKILQLIYLHISFYNEIKMKELLNIKRDIIDLSPNSYNDYIYFIDMGVAEKEYDKNKGYDKNISKMIHIKSETMEYIKKYLKTRKDNNEFLFVSKSPNGIIDKVTPSALSYWCKESFSKVLDKKIKHSSLYGKNRKNVKK